MEREYRIRNNVRRVRVQQGITQQELASSAGVTRQTIGLIEVERYNPTVALAFRIARALQTPIENLFWMEEDDGRGS
ncbi:MAG: helix-turn-helix transcriptional regulator [Armatimonadota bacterium]